MNTTTQQVIVPLALAGIYWGLYALWTGHYQPNAGCHGRGHYLLPGKYPAPTRSCALKALAYAKWPHNRKDAAAVAQAVLDSRWGQDPEVAARAYELLEEYEALPMAANASH